MDDVLFSRWKLAVDRDDTIVLVGDVSFWPLRGAWLERIRRAPGRKVLVFGNHDVAAGGNVGEGFDEVYSTLYVAGNPPLLVTHSPLREVPAACVSVHGHLHVKRLPGRYVNVGVEQVDYRPQPLTAIRRLAARLALPVPQISLAGLVNHPNSSRSSKAKAMATSWV